MKMARLSGDQLRRRILRFLLDWEHTGLGKLPELTDITSAVGVTESEVSDQVDILESMGALRSNRTLGGGASPMLTGGGKALLEKLEGDATAHAQRLGQKVAPAGGATPPTYEWDFFICHASEDKVPFVHTLAEELARRRVRVWYDAFTLVLGDSLRRSIDRGLARSRYGIVVLSRNFFSKEWPQKELDGLLDRERQGEKVILPIWFDVDEEYVIRYSPLLVDRIAAIASEGLDATVEKLLQVLGRSPA